MKLNNYIKKRLFIITLIIVILECFYLFILPFSLNKLLEKNLLQKYLNNKIPVTVSLKKAQIKTHIVPKISCDAEKIEIKTNDENNGLFAAENFKIDLSLIDILRKKINIEKISADSIYLYAVYEKDGLFNFEKIFKKEKDSVFKFKLKNSKINIKKYVLDYEDEILNKKFQINSTGLIVNYDNKKKINIISKGSVNQDGDLCDYDIDLFSKLSVSNRPELNSVNGKMFIYNVDLALFMPYINKYIDKNLKTLSGYVKYIQLSTEKNDGNNNIILNTAFNDVVYDRNDWKNYIFAKGENKVHSNIEFDNDTLKINSFGYEAQNIDITSDGTVEFENKKPYLDINVKVNDSKAENIASILPPNLVPHYMTIEKIKNYGVYGDIKSELNIKGNIPQPDIVGYVKADNVHVLDKSIHNLHKGTVFIRFEKRILNMDILVEMFNKQKAEVKGYVYMFRDGINNVTVKTTDNIDFPLAQKIIVPVSKVFNFQLGPIPDMNIDSGKGIIDINIKGNINFVNINGFSSFYDAYLSYNGLFGKVIKGKGRLDFKDDIISFKSEKAFVKTNPLSVEGKVKINDNLDFNISSSNADAKDLLEIINKSTLLKDVKEGIKIITDANGRSRLFVNMKAKIVPVPFGHPPLPPEEAFQDIKVKGSLYLMGDSCYIEGFYTPIENLKGIVDFTETVVDINAITGMSGTSPVTISGKIITDLETKIPDVDLTVTSKEVNLRDTIKFLTKSYLYPKNYPDLSCLYKIASKHDLYFKYKAKAIDFITDKAYAEMKFIEDNEDNPIKAKSGKIIMDKSTVTVENVKASLFDSDLFVDGKVLRVDTVNPVYNLKIKTDSLNLRNLNDLSKVTIMPEKAKDFIEKFRDFSGFADIDVIIDKNILKGRLLVKQLKMFEKTTSLPFEFDTFPVKFENGKLIIDNLTATISDMPFFGNILISDLNKTPDIKGYFTLKLKNKFINEYVNKNLGQNISLEGDISLSSKIKGSISNIIIEPKLVLNPDADITIGGINVGDVNEKRVFNGKINIIKDKIFINNFIYTKYIASQNNKMNAIVFASSKGEVKINGNVLEPVFFELKTNKNLPARILNVFLKTPVLTQGIFNCNLRYAADTLHKRAKLTGTLDCRNIDIPLFDTLVKNIHLNADDSKINISLFGFISDSRVNVSSVIKNNFALKPQVESLNIYMEQIDRNKMFNTFSKLHNAMNTNNKIKNTDLNRLIISKGRLEVKELLVKSMVAKNFAADFSVDEEGIFKADNMSVDIGQGSMFGKMSYNLNNTVITGDFTLNNVDSDYIADTLFEGKNQIYGNANGKMYLNTKGSSDMELIENLCGNINFDISDGRMPKLGSLEYLLHASNILKSGITGFTLNSILELLNLVKTGYFSNISGNCIIENGVAKNIEIFSKGENMSLYIHGTYNIAQSHADLEILGKLSKRISTIFGKIGNTSLNTFFRLIPGISLLDFGRKDFIEDVEKIPSFTNGDYESRVFQAIINGNINESGYVQSFKWVKQ